MVMNETNSVFWFFSKYYIRKIIKTWLLWTLWWNQSRPSWFWSRILADGKHPKVENYSCFGPSTFSWFWSSIFLDLSLPSLNCNLSFLSCPLCAVHFGPCTSSQLKRPFFLNDVQSGTSQLICVSRIVPNEEVLNEKTRKGKPSVIILALNNS